MKKNTLNKLLLATALTFGTFTTVPHMITPICAEEIESKEFYGNVTLKQDTFMCDGDIKNAVVTSVTAFEQGMTGNQGKTYTAIDHQLTDQDEEGSYIYMNDTTVDSQVAAGDYQTSVSGTLIDHTKNEDGTFTDTEVGNFSDTVTWTIKAGGEDTVSVETGTITLTNSLTYNGNEQTQEIKFEVNDLILKEGTDYSVSGNKATEAGTYTLTVTGMGRYTGTITKEYTINAKAVDPEKKTTDNTPILIGAGIAGVAVVTSGIIIAKNKKNKKQ